MNMILASTRNLGIGKDNDLPWPRLKNDMKFFKTTTTGQSIIMGYNTFESLQKKALPNRLNVVLTRKPKSVYEQYASDKLMFFGDMQEALNYLDERDSIKENYIIGGSTIYNSVLKHQDELASSRLNVRLLCSHDEVTEFEAVGGVLVIVPGCQRACGIELRVEGLV